ncbi:MAG: hypothetical protein AAF611_13460 [Bacteroidota bacterium]
MSLKSDIDEILKEWKTSSKWFKIVVIVSAFITLSSVASLSDTIFAWKGFILDGVEFYRITILEPIRHLFLIIDIKLSIISTNLLIIWLIIFGSIIRLLFYLAKETNSLRRFFQVFSLVAISLLYKTILYYISFHYNLLEKYLERALVYNLAIFLIIFSYLLYKLVNYKKALLILVGPLLLSIVVILILAAINSGLTR